MGLARAWRRGLYASAGLTVIVPAALLVTLGLLAAGGGSFDLASLGQVISGPSAPTVQPLALGVGGGGQSGRGGAAASTSTLLAAALPPATSRHSSGSGPASSHRVGGDGTGVANPHGGGNGVPNPRRGGGGGSGPPVRHHHSPPPTVADKVVGAVTPVTSGLPAPAGPVLTGVVKQTGSLADQILRKLPKS